jgi:hypothetical protein
MNDENNLAVINFAGEKLNWVAWGDGLKLLPLTHGLLPSPPGGHCLDSLGRQRGIKQMRIVRLLRQHFRFIQGQPKQVPVSIQRFVEFFHDHVLGLLDFRHKSFVTFFAAIGEGVAAGICTDLFGSFHSLLLAPLVVVCLVK